MAISGGTQLSDKPRKKTTYLGGVKQSIYGTETVVTPVRKVCILEKSPSKSQFWSEISHFQERRALRARWPCGGALWAARGGLLSAQRMARAENSWENGEFMVIV